MDFEPDFTPGCKKKPQEISYISDVDRDFFEFQTRKPKDNKDIETFAERKDIETLILKINAAKEKGDDFNIEDIEDLTLEKIDNFKYLMAEFFLKSKRDSLGEDLIKEYEEIVENRKQMEKIYIENYSNNKGLKDKLVEDFNMFMGKPSENYKYEQLSLSSNEVFVLKYKGKVISFNKFKNKSWKKLYFQFFNVDKETQGSGIGQLMCKATLDKKAEEGYTILADSIASRPISSFYIESGFIGKNMSELHSESIISIIRNDVAIPSEFKTKNLSKEEILKGIGLPEGTIVNRSPTQESCDFKYIIPENYTRKEDLSPYHKAPEKYVLTRYFLDKDSKEWITVFELVSRELDDFI